MAKYILKRILWMIPVLLGVLFIVFTISYFTPGDPVMSMLGTNFTQAAYDAKRAELGLDRPFLVQFVDYVVKLVTKFDMGVSYTYGHEVAGEIAARFGVTLKLGLWSVLFTTVVGIPVGILSATHQYSILDYGATFVSLFFAAMPNFWLALMLILVFSLNLGWLPVTGMGTWKHWILPVIANAMPVLAGVSRQARSNMLDVIRSDYIRTARAKGLKESQVILRHGLRNSFIPVLTVIGIQIGLIMAGSVIVESIFGIPGLGNYMLAGISNRDYPIINACVLTLAATISVMNLVVDIAYGFVDPRTAVTTKGKKKKKAAKPAAAAGGEN